MHSRIRLEALIVLTLGSHALSEHEHERTSIPGAFSCARGSGEKTWSGKACIPRIIHQTWKDCGAVAGGVCICVGKMGAHTRERVCSTTSAHAHTHTRHGPVHTRAECSAHTPAYIHTRTRPCTCADTHMRVRTRARAHTHTTHPYT